MIRKLIITIFAVLTASIAFANTRPPAIAQTYSSFHLMNDSEFAAFLDRLDAEMLESKVHLKKVNVKSLDLDLLESKELENSNNRCLQSLDNVREDIQELTQRQTLKFDLLLLIDLNELARNLDALDQGLVNPGTKGGSRAARKSLAYAKDVLGIDAALAPRISAFQYHILAFTGAVDATLDQAEQETPQPLNQK
jgi:cobalamin biosynthesis Mg chelatase CobN